LLFYAFGGSQSWADLIGETGIFEKKIQKKDYIGC